MKFLKVYHMAIDLRSVLQYNHSKKIDFIEHENGRLMNDASAREYIHMKLAAGYRKIPAFNDCELFHPVKGCPGHLVPDEKTDKKKISKPKLTK